MGTRADFYIGTGETAKWLGSIAWDGGEFYEEKSHPIMERKTEKGFIKAVQDMFKDRTDVSTPKTGWPWPWEDSTTTDVAYCWDPETKTTKVYSFGKKMYQTKNDMWTYQHNTKESAFPNMKHCQKVDFGERSGITLIGS